jgi:hypothetical protein
LLSTSATNSNTNHLLLLLMVNECHAVIISCLCPEQRRRSQTGTSAVPPRGVGK